MSKKDITIKNPPTSKIELQKQEMQEFVNGRIKQKEEQLTLTISLPASLHRDIKIACATDGKKIREVMQAMLERYLEERKQ